MLFSLFLLLFSTGGDKFLVDIVSEGDSFDNKTAIVEIVLLVSRAPFSALGNSFGNTFVSDEE